MKVDHRVNNTSINNPINAPTVLEKIPGSLFSLIPLAVIVVVEISRQTGLVFPAPFLSILAAAAFASAIGGFAAATLTALYCAGYLVYGWLTGFGPPALVGSPYRLIFGISIIGGVAFSLGYVREKNTELLKKLRANERKLTRNNELLEEGVADRTATLESVNRELSNSRAQAHDLLNRLQAGTRLWMQAEEKERRRIANEIHDEIGQSLAAVSNNLSRIQEALIDDPRQTALARETKEIITTIFTSVRQLLHDLRPPLLDEFGLTHAIETSAGQLAERTDTAITFDLQTGDNLDDTVKTAIFRVTLEAVSNALNHAQATQIDVMLLEQGEFVELLVRDNGKGFAIDPVELLQDGANHMGLASMRDRAELLGGKFKITTTLGEGAEVCAMFAIASPN